MSGPMRARVNSGYRDVDLDKTTRALQIIDHAEHEIHDGRSFHAEYSTVTAATDAHRTGIMFKTPNTAKHAHMIVTVSASDPAEIIINEAPTLADSGDGSDLAVYNRNRNLTVASVLSSLEDVPTVGSLTSMTEAEMVQVGVSAGTELEHIFIAGGSGPFAVGGLSRGTEEWVLKANTIYVIYLENTGANANTHHISLDWHEYADEA